MYHYYRLNIAGLTVNMRNKRYQRLDRLQEDLFSICENARELSRTDRKSTRLNSSHQIISYAVFCLKKKKKKKKRVNKYKKQKQNRNEKNREGKI